MRKIVQCIVNVHMSLEHRGLARLLRENFKIDVRKLPSESLILCVNRRKTACKVLGGGGSVLGYLRNLADNPLSLEQIAFIAQTFGAPKFQMSPAATAEFRDLNLEIAQAS